jgi:hypothetical protein
MKNIADHILDITENSVRAEAKKIEILLSTNTDSKLMKLSFIDDGIGMSEDMIEKIKDPFFSTRTTRRIGMGIPLLMQNSEMSGGQVIISSKEGEGTIVVATFESDNLDCPPVGDVADAIYFLSSTHPDIQLLFTDSYGGKTYTWNTAEVNQALDGVPLGHHEFKESLMEMLNENIKEVNS